MICEETRLEVADNTGARVVKCFRIYGQHKSYAHIGDVIRVSVKEAQPGGMVKKGQTLRAIIVRTVSTQRTGDSIWRTSAWRMPSGEVSLWTWAL